MTEDYTLENYDHIIRSVKKFFPAIGEDNQDDLIQESTETALRRDMMVKEPLHPVAVRSLTKDAWEHLTKLKKHLHGKLVPINFEEGTTEDGELHQHGEIRASEVNPTAPDQLLRLEMISLMPTKEEFEFGEMLYEESRKGKSIKREQETRYALGGLQMNGDDFLKFLN